MNKLIKIFKVLSDKNRLRILLMLSKKTLCVCEIQDIFGIADSTVSKHLSILRDACSKINAYNFKWFNYRLKAGSIDLALYRILKLITLNLNYDQIIKSDMEKVNLIC